jgi:hypothetical protein
VEPLDVGAQLLDGRKVQEGWDSQRRVQGHADVSVPCCLKLAQPGCVRVRVLQDHVLGYKMKLVDFPVIYLNPDHNTKYRARKKHMDGLLTRIGFKNITHFKTSTEAYPRCLLKATIEVLSMHLDDNPILILEDDIEEYQPLNASTELVLPDDTDAFYLGFSKAGGHATENRMDGNSKVIPHGSYHLIQNMLGGHAVVYKSRQYKERVIQELRDILHIPRLHKDIILSRIQKDYKIYSYHHPFFYQAVHWGNSKTIEELTRFSFNRNGVPIPKDQCTIM